MYEPDVVVVLDPTVMNITKVDDGLKADGIIVINTGRSIADLRQEYGFKQKVSVVDASHIAMETLGLPITNTVMLGALVKATGIIKPESIKEPLSHRFGPVAPKNQKAFDRAFAETQLEG